MPNLRSSVAALPKKSNTGPVALRRKPRSIRNCLFPRFANSAAAAVPNLPFSDQSGNDACELANRTGAHSARPFGVQQAADAFGRFRIEGIKSVQAILRTHPGELAFGELACRIQRSALGLLEILMI